MLIVHIVWAHIEIYKKIILLRFGNIKKSIYICNCYPENNLFTLKKLIPIEDIRRLPVKAIALFLYILNFKYRYLNL